MIDLYTTGAKHQNAAMATMLQGIPDKGAIKPIAGIGRPTLATTAICWGSRYLELLKKHYKKVVVMEQGYFNDRSRFYSLGIGGLNGFADFRNYDRPSDRWEKYRVPITPWQTAGDYYLIMGQVPGDMSISGIDIESYYATMAAELIKRTDKPVYFRPHPLARQESNVLPILKGPLKESLRHAAGVVTFNSNSGVDAVIAGAPVMVGNRGSMAWSVAAKTVDQLINFNFPGRMQWLYNLAYTQWTLDELTDGTAWGHLCKR